MMYIYVLPYCAIQAAPWEGAIVQEVLDLLCIKGDPVERTVVAAAAAAAQSTETAMVPWTPSPTPTPVRTPMSRTSMSEADAFEVGAYSIFGKIIAADTPQDALVPADTPPKLERSVSSHSTGSFLSGGFHADLDPLEERDLALAVGRSPINQGKHHNQNHVLAVLRKEKLAAKGQGKGHAFLLLLPCIAVAAVVCK